MSHVTAGTPVLPQETARHTRAVPIVRVAQGKKTFFKVLPPPMEEMPDVMIPVASTPERGPLPPPTHRR